MNNRIMRIAALEIAKDTDNVIKVATMLGRIKRWISSMFSPAVSRQIEEISAKHMNIKPFIDAVNADIKGIENAIENVDTVAYDYKIKDLLKNVSTLNRILSEMQGVIIETQKEVNKEKESQSKKGARAGRIITKGPLYKQYTPGKTLQDVGLAASDISFSSKTAFYSSFMSKSFKGFGAGGVESLKEAGFDADQIRQVIQDAKNNEIFNTAIMNDLSNYKIIALYGRPTNDEARQYECVLKINGTSNFNVDNLGQFVVNTSIFVGILTIPTIKKGKSLKINVESVLPVTATSESETATEPESEPTPEPEPTPETPVEE